MRFGSKRRKSRLVSQFEDRRFSTGAEASGDQGHPCEAHPEKARGLRAATRGIEAEEGHHTVMNILSIDDLEALHARMDQALAELDRGEFVDGEEFMQRMIDELDAKEAQRKAGWAATVLPHRLMRTWVAGAADESLRYDLKPGVPNEEMAVDRIWVGRLRRRRLSSMAA